MLPSFRIKYNYFILLLFILIGAVLRFYHLAFFDLWFDEAQSIISATDFDFYLHDFFKRDYSSRFIPPLYYTILHFWIKYFGVEEFSLRFLSAIAGVGSIPLIFLLGKKFYNTRVGLISALILALSPFHIWYAQEARFYSLSIFFSLLMAFSFFKIAQSRRKLFWYSAAVIISVINFYLNYFSFFLFFSLVLFSIQYKNNNGLKPLFIFLYTTIAFLPFIPFFYKQIASIARSFWMFPPRFQDIFNIIGNFFLGYNATVNQFYLAITIVLLSVGIWFFTHKRKKNEYLLLSCSILPLLFFFVIGRYILPIYLSRYLIIFSPFFYILVSSLVLRIKYKKVFYLFLSFLVGLMIFSLSNYYQGKIVAPFRFHFGVYEKKTFKNAVKIIKDNFLPGDIIAHSYVSTIDPFLYYLRKIPVRQKFVIITEEFDDKYWRDKIKSVEQWRTKKPYKRKYYYGSPSFEFYKEHYNKRTWLISSNWARDGMLRPHSLAVRERFSQEFDRAKSFYRDGIYIDLFIPKK
ncbi:MAG: glycosyltransferase family 39 protein [Candidatus Omnitrophica bacterium]|nr:glycosyltransferase family 39 protein [Candidatus Omnitrophota bacterium]MCF7891961.1 glycosyltransferase family 39 protein [Candidatus Omnitrophota bacterium]MCF7895477.1 glycosyltransferase family 39 protein [Candidatus Omnitrophota bacterium]MCF7898010.1 glycosyltransferase family 39 protein [Candidatus Omnitrophota bacterium]MCF7909636.1 glycosyltransferase family 39 protein [Candidatus Omnitrophota bacterium]